MVIIVVSSFPHADSVLVLQLISLPFEHPVSMILLFHWARAAKSYRWK